MFNVIVFGKCNLACDYCFAEDYMGIKESINDPKTMSHESYNDIVNFLSLSKTDHISLLGGEPTLHPNFNDFLKTAQKKDILISVKTNALFNRPLEVLFDGVNQERIFLHINLNNPSSMSKEKWEKTLQNIKKLKQSSMMVDFQINIADINFKYDYLWPVLEDFPKSNLYWTLTVPIAATGSSNKAIDPFTVKSKLMPRVLELLDQAKKQGHKTLGVHGITPCLFPKGFLEDNKDHHTLASECVPVFDFYPDDSVHYCFPLEGVESFPSYKSFKNLQEIQYKFLWQAARARPFLFPWDKCDGCVHALSGDCHGGCMANKPWLKEAMWSGQEQFWQLIPKLTKDLNLVIKAFPKTAWDKNLKSKFFSSAPELWSKVASSIDGKRSWQEILNLLAQKSELPNDDLKLWLEFSSYNLLGSQNAVLLPTRHRHQRNLD